MKNGTFAIKKPCSPSLFAIKMQLQRHILQSDTEVENEKP